MNNLTYNAPEELISLENLIFEKKNVIPLLTKEEKKLDNSIYDSILQKTISFRNNFFKKPKIVLKRFIPKKISLSMFAIPFFSFVGVSVCFSFIYLFREDLLSDNCSISIIVPGIIGLYSTISSIVMLFLSVKEFIYSFSKRKELLDCIKSFNSIQDLLIFFKKSNSSINYFNKKLLITDTLKLTDSIFSFSYLSSQELKSFLELFSKEELLLIEDSLNGRFNDNQIHSIVLDDICYLAEGKIKEKDLLSQKTNKKILYQDFISEYIEPESQEGIATYDFKSVL